MKSCVWEILYELSPCLYYYLYSMLLWLKWYFLCYPGQSPPPPAWAGNSWLTGRRRTAHPACAPSLPAWCLQCSWQFKEIPAQYDCLWKMRLCCLFEMLPTSKLTIALIWLLVSSWKAKGQGAEKRVGWIALLEPLLGLNTINRKNKPSQDEHPKYLSWSKACLSSSQSR